eukprot:CAMPEP_0172465296 /NCGR_PEP_ID=MMETSP1065-20121228/53092_1 /TAXON_ID=265537 /ORGANISM="Amphiprora paludosa, Strain CCMP125" /LENGTH=32 /DNA_ID= /DNA_START= /DNA_END= /DNA_ORIENTATION=
MEPQAFGSCGVQIQRLVLPDLAQQKYATAKLG